jgi:hypothetical protein
MKSNFARSRIVEPRIGLQSGLLRRAAPVALLMLTAASPCHAQYKVVGPDGKVTYTDRAPASSNGKITSLTARGGTAVGDAALPLELRQAAARYPVTLYVTPRRQRSARTTLGRARRPDADHRLANPAWPGAGSVEFLPRRGRLPT